MWGGVSLRGRGLRGWDRKGRDLGAAPEGAWPEVGAAGSEHGLVSWVGQKWAWPEVGVSFGGIGAEVGVASTHPLFHQELQMGGWAGWVPQGPEGGEG